MCACSNFDGDRHREVRWAAWKHCTYSMLTVSMIKIVFTDDYPQCCYSYIFKSNNYRLHLNKYFHGFSEVVTMSDGVSTDG